MNQQTVDDIPNEESCIIPIVTDGRDHASIVASFQYGLSSNIGQVREVNEDSAFATIISRVSHLNSQSLGLFMVADGMGGHEAGEQASLAAIQVAGECLLREVIMPLTSPKSEMWDSIPVSEAMTHAFEEAHRKVMEAVPDSATTLTIALLMDRRIYVGHAGDCRLYIFNNQTLHPITRDHSVLNRLMELGQLDLEDADLLATDPRRNVLYQAIGQAEDVEFDFFSQLLEPEEALLLCSDGLWGTVPDDIMSDIVKEAESPAIACQNLVNEANQRGGPDNITVILICPVGSCSEPAEMGSNTGQ
jgi:PPM family protein phosphatase